MAIGGEYVESTDKIYVAPQVVDYGDLVELTAASQNGGFTDATFPAHTPAANITFSGA